MSTLCRALRECQRNVCQRNKTERVRGFHSPDNHSFDEFFRPRRIRPFFLSALALASADAPYVLGGFAFNSGKSSQPSQSVAVMFVKAPTSPSRRGGPDDLTMAGLSRRSSSAKAEKKTERTVRTVKSVFAHFSIVTHCRPICSNRKWRRASYGLYVILYGWGYGGEGVNES